MVHSGVGVDVSMWYGLNTFLRSTIDYDYGPSTNKEIETNFHFKKSNYYQRFVGAENKQHNYHETKVER